MSKSHSTSFSTQLELLMLQEERGCVVSRNCVTDEYRMTTRTTKEGNPVYALQSKLAQNHTAGCCSQAKECTQICTAEPSGDVYLSVQSMKLNNFMYRFYFFKYSLPVGIFNQLISASLHTRKSHCIREREKGVKERQSVVSVL